MVNSSPLSGSHNALVSGFVPWWVLHPNPRLSARTSDTGVTVKYNKISIS
jgi:hypothetical protein